MAKFLTTAGNSFHIEQIIIKAEKNLTLVTPYLNLSKNFLERLSDANKKGVSITLIYGKSELRRNERQKIENLENFEIFFCENLHAKCYHNESELIITSMNLYEFSEKNNREMGILIKKVTDQEIFEETLAEIESIKNASIKEKEFKITSTTVESSKPTEKSRRHIEHPPFSREYDFHVPKLFEALKKKYVNHSIILTDYIELNNFPNNMVDMTIDGRIILDFKDEKHYQDLRYSSKYALRSQLPGVRFYWNNSGLKIYLAKNFSVEVNQQGQKLKVEKFMTMVDMIYNELNKK